MNRFLLLSLLAFCKLSLFLLLYPSSADASGTRLPEASLAGLGTADALVANPKELGALVYNPAGMSFHDRSSLSVGLILINPHLSVSPEGGSGKVDSDGRSIIPLPNLYATWRFHPEWSFGLNISSPFGLETDWPDETFSAFTHDKCRSQRQCWY